MVRVNEFRITEDGKHLIINVQVRPEDYYENVYIDVLDLYTDEQWPLRSDYRQKAWEEDYGGELRKEINIILSKDDMFQLINIGDHMFVLSILTSGVVKPGVPCGMDNKVTYTVAIPTQGILSNFMQLLGQVGNDCEIPKELIDQILKYKTFDMVVKQGDIDNAIAYYQKWYKDSEYTGYKRKNCGCNG